MLLRIMCGRGTYIRTLCHDIGRAAGCPAHMRFLLREQTGPFTLDTAVTIEELKAAAQTGTLTKYLLPLDIGLGHLPRYDVPLRLEKLCRNGVRLRPDEWPAPLGGAPVRLYAQGALIGISQADEEGALVPRLVLPKQEG